MWTYQRSKSGEAFSCFFFLKCWQCRRALKTLHQHWLHFYCWQIQNHYVILIIHQQLATGCKLQVWGFWGVLVWLKRVFVGLFLLTEWCRRKQAPQWWFYKQGHQPLKQEMNLLPTAYLKNQNWRVSEKTPQISGFSLHNPLYRGFLFQTGRTKLLWKDSIGSYSDIYLFLKILHPYSS